MNITTFCDNVFSGPGSIHSFFPAPLPLCGLTLHIRAKAQSCTVLIDLEQVDDMLKQRDLQLPNRVLSSSELLHFKRFGYPKRKREWLGGRISAKVAMLKLSRPDRIEEQLQRLSIMPDDHGRPVTDRMEDLSISISHSGRFAVGFAIRGTTCGIDLQEISQKLSGLTGRFASARELTVLAELSVPGGQATGLTMLWAVKEALKKSLLYDQPALFSGIEVQRIAMTREDTYRFCCTVAGHIGQTAMVYNFAPYILALSGADHA